MEHIPKRKKGKKSPGVPLARGRKPVAGALQRRGPRLEIIGDRVLVDGLRRVLSYTSGAWCCKWASAG